MNRLPTRQRGFGWLGNLLTIILVAGFVLAGFKVAPYYLEYYKVRGAVEALKKRDDLATMTPVQIYRVLDDQLYIDEVRRLTQDNIKIRRNVSQVMIEVKYEIRDHLVGNIDFVLLFEHSLRLNVS